MRYSSRKKNTKANFIRKGRPYADPFRIMLDKDDLISPAGLLSFLFTEGMLWALWDYLYFLQFILKNLNMISV